MHYTQRPKALYTTENTLNTTKNSAVKGIIHNGQRQYTQRTKPLHTTAKGAVHNGQRHYTQRPKALHKKRVWFLLLQLGTTVV